MRQAQLAVAIQVCHNSLFCTSKSIFFFCLVNERRPSFHLGENDDDLSNDSPPMSKHPIEGEPLKRVN